MIRNFKIVLILLIFSNIMAVELLNLGSISFKAMNWTEKGDLLYSKTNSIQDFTSRGIPVVIHFFTSDCD
ncbi:MAG: hypothetical protein PF638_09265 [Candidatus Delongbacteria bacterium]|nr:hypothetical protein [Candidatus Delongbacteria bacterium]